MLILCMLSKSWFIMKILCRISTVTHWQSFANSEEMSLVLSCSILTVSVAAAAIIAT